MKLSAPSFYRSVIVLSVTGITHKKESGPGGHEAAATPGDVVFTQLFLAAGCASSSVCASRFHNSANLGFDQRGRRKPASQDSSSRVCNQVSMTGLRSQLGF
jgi:hypothetical protein